MSAAIESGTVKRALSAHAAIGLIAGALLYLVSLTGTICVFAEELQRIEQPDAPEMAQIAPDAVQRGVEAMLAAEADKPVTSHLYVHMPSADLPRATITTDNGARHLHPDGSLAEPEEIAWTDFLVALHYKLNLPSLVGISIVGALGVMMLALSLSGVVAHPRIFRDAFRLRARDKGGVGLADWHNRMSVWTLPFSIAIALTGAAIGLASLTAFSVASAGYGGDAEAVFATIFGDEPTPDKAPAPMPDVASALRHMASEKPDIAVDYVVLEDPQTAGQAVRLIGKPERRLIFGEYYGFDARGRFTGSVGLSDGALGQQAAASTYDLHFGNFGGLWVKIAYFVFGTALTAICATGTYIWLGKRRRRGQDELVLRAGWDGIVWGAPLAVAATFAARLLWGNETPFAAIFWIIYLIVVVAFIALKYKCFYVFSRSKLAS
ncbi:PepSY domain-containing protein [Novosphingobium sp. PY1]|uniref:PepSY-associated TM helix domain-containing protein n=1 Tax=Novosphingobium sp. PY1 TaxID=1882221 RepID=UPI000BE781EE|nr:PepSY-associated TM helix domain-containing protein [Novosphingobium sp. PY1]BBA74016.1 PepSY-associated TM helix family protein [Novosphingobium sp. PY1]GFM31253.1 PepSY-associated TM helix family protein [Novosphingobium sp. PY1]